MWQRRQRRFRIFSDMIILFCLFIVQFAIACSCLAVNKQQQMLFAEEGWNTVSDETKSEVQRTFNCCGFNSTLADDHPSCDVVNKICCLNSSDPACACPPCLPKLETNIDNAFFVSGSIGLFFSFTEVNFLKFSSSVMFQWPSHLLTNNKFFFSAFGSNFNRSLSKPKKSPRERLLVNTKQKIFLSINYASDMKLFN